jgi:Holliday junction resolvase-like predicted endonuclease
MQARRGILLALLKESKEGVVDREKLRELVRINNEVFQIFMNELVSRGLVEEVDSQFRATQNQRLDLAVKTVEAGVDLEKVGRALGWLEFEEIVAHVFEENGYRVKRRFRFSANGRRWEIDVLAVRRPLVVCVECKHWSRGLGNTTARKIVESHMAKVQVLSEVAGRLRRLGLEGWNRAVFVPMALSLQSARNRIYRRVPVVSVFELPSFLNEFEGQMDWLLKYPVNLSGARAREVP